MASRIVALMPSKPAEGTPSAYPLPKHLWSQYGAHPVAPTRCKGGLGKAGPGRVATSHNISTLCEGSPDPRWAEAIAAPGAEWQGSRYHGKQRCTGATCCMCTCSSPRSSGPVPLHHWALIIVFNPGCALQSPGKLEIHPCPDPVIISCAKFP